MRELPRGTVTLLFTDIEGSTRLLQDLGDRYGQLLEEHHGRLRDTIDARGVEVDAQGDGFLFAFERADDAVAAAADAQRALSGLEAIRVRMGLHTGQPRPGGAGYVGLDVHRAARICGAAHGGQVLLSQTTRDLADADVRDLGEHRLKDLTQPQRLYQLVGPDLQYDFAPPRTLENRPTNLPVQPTPLIGRERELAEAVELVRHPDVRLVTLTGVGGCGKTRLALQAAAELVEEFPDGVFFVALEAVEDPGLVIATVAQTLGVNETGAPTLTEAVRNVVGDRRLLLVLDNFEQLLNAGPQVRELLAPTQATLLITSRAPLRLSGEHEYQVPPLGLPDMRALPDFGALSQYDSVALFIERAQAVRADFEVTAENAPAIAEICARLDGLPLAIELAAARVRLLGPKAMLARLEQRLALLTGGPRDLPSRQQTLRGAIDWSYGLLDENGRRLFERLSVFAGGCRLDAAEAVCDAGLDELEALLENNLLRQEERPDGEPRFHMLETIREYASERLRDADAAPELHRRHADYFLRWAESQFEARERGDLIGGYSAEDEEHENVRAALAWLRQEGESELELRLARAMFLYWGAGGYLSEGRGALEEALARGTSASELVQARAMVAAANVAWRQGDEARTEELATTAIPILEDAGDRRALADALNARAIAAEWRGDLEAEDRLQAQVEAIHRELGNARGLATILGNRGYAAIILGDYERAERLLRESVSLLEPDDRNFAWHFLNVGLALLRQRRLPEARSAFRQSLEHPNADTEIVFYALEGLANVAAAEGDDCHAARLWGASELIRERTGAKLARAEQELHDELVPKARERAGAEAFDRVWADARLLTEEQAISLAVEDPATRPAAS